MTQSDGVTRRGVLGMSIAAGAGAVTATESKLTALAAPRSRARKRRKKPQLFAKAQVTQIQLGASNKLVISLTIVYVYSAGGSGASDFGIGGLDPTLSAAALRSTIIEQVRGSLSTSGIPPEAIDVVIFGGPS